MVNIQKLTKKVKRKFSLDYEVVCSPLKVSVFLNAIFAKGNVKTTIWGQLTMKSGNVYYIVAIFDDNSDSFYIAFRDDTSLSDLINRIEHIESFVSGKLTYLQLRKLYTDKF